MKVYIVRHGKAASSAVDPQRGLTPEGREQVEKVAAHLASLDITVDAVWHSGKTRAEQTAQILARAITVKEGVLARAGLSPNDHVGPIRDEIQLAGQDAMIVGHLPFVGVLTSLLLTGSDSNWPMDFNEATVVCLGNHPDGAWKIEWSASPDSAPAC
jgi:phosphohistidine phosphatase